MNKNRATETLIKGKNQKQTSVKRLNIMWPKYDSETKPREKGVDSQLGTHTIIIHKPGSVIHIMEYSRCQFLLFISVLRLYPPSFINSVSHLVFSFILHFCMSL